MADGDLLDKFGEALPLIGVTDERFAGRETRRYDRRLTYPAALYRDYLSTISMYRILEPARADAALAETVAVIEQHGGAIEFQVSTDMAIAWKRERLCRLGGWLRAEPRGVKAGTAGGKGRNRGR